MSFGRQKRLLIGLLALLAPVPLPWNDVLSWPVFAAYTVAVLLFLRRAQADPPRWLPNWAMNVLGCAYLPLFALDLLALNRGHLVQPVVHLILFSLAVKLFAMGRERDKWQAALGIFFLFLAAMGTSVHPSIVLYLIAFLVLTLVMLVRFAFLHVLSDFSRDDPTSANLPISGFLTVTTVGVLILAVPLFALLPRVRSPYIIGRGAGTGTTIEAAGFSDDVSLNSIGQIRNSSQVAMRVQPEGPPSPVGELRFKAATYDIYQGGSWRRSPPGEALERRGIRFSLLPDVKAEHWLRIYLQPLHSRSVPLPVETVIVEPQAPTLATDQGGAVSFAFDPQEVREYRVGLLRRPVLIGAVPAANDDTALDGKGVTPRIAALAKEVMGSGTADERVLRVEQHLIQSYSYTLDFQGRSVNNPIEDFLFQYKSGQCEYFASAMVLMLRSQHIPARLVTGFLGAEFNPFEGYYIVRDSNAHAWVEAYLGDGEGWRIYDPTPPAGRPAAKSEGLWLTAHQAWDFLLFRWDRYVLTFGLNDQLRLFGSLRDLWKGMWDLFARAQPDIDTPKAALPAVASPPPPLVPAASSRSPWLSPTVLVSVVLFVLLLGLYLLWRLRPPLTATLAYQRLRRRLARYGSATSQAAGPLAVRDEAIARFPAAAQATGKVIDCYLRESFGGEELEEGERAALEQALGEAEKLIKPLKKAG